MKYGVEIKCTDKCGSPKHDEGWRRLAPYYFDTDDLALASSTAEYMADEEHVTRVVTL